MQRATCATAILLTLAALCGGAGARAVSAQESWVYSPYQVRVWLAVAQGPRLTADLTDELRTAVVRHARIAAGSTWRVTVEPAPDAIRTELLRDLKAVTSERVMSVDPKAAADDKIMLVTVDESAHGFAIAACEWDSRTQVVGPVVSHEVMQREVIGTAVSQAVLEAFAPIARIDDVKGVTASIRFRAAGLAIEPHCVSAPQIGQALMAVTRQNDRYGNPKPNGLRVLEWTILLVKSVDGLRVECEALSINRGYLGGRSSSRIERYGLGVRVPFASTELELRSKEGVGVTMLQHDKDQDRQITRDEVPINLVGVLDRIDTNHDGIADQAELQATKRPLVGYDIYTKDPVTEESELLGQTDWRGRLLVPPAANGGVRVLYVRSGGMLLARLPLVPGQAAVATAELVDDEKRLQAEAFVRSIQSTLVDLVAQRELLAARARKQIKDGKFDEAQKLVDQFRTLPSLADMRQRLDAAKQETISKNPKIQPRIDQMYNDTDALLIKYLDPNLVEKLTTELGQARGGGS